MLIDLYVLHYNEERTVKLITAYWKLLPLRKIFVIDNLSTDGSLDYIRSHFSNVEVLLNEEKQINDYVYMMIKRNVWKRSRGLVDFVIVSDFDEVVYSPDIVEELQYMKDRGCTVADLFALGSVCYDRDFPADDNLLAHQQPGVRFFYDRNYDKKVLFDPNRISEMNYLPGAHQVDIQGEVKFYKSKIHLLHLTNLGLDFMIDRRKVQAARLSELNKRNGWGIHLNFSSEQYAADFNRHYAESKTWEEWHRPPATAASYSLVGNAANSPLSITVSAK